MTDEHIRIVEINGVKVEVDLRQCKVIENYKIGDQVKILKKEYSGYKSFPGVIIGFEDFKKLPSILICYLEDVYNGAEVKFLTFNSATEDIEICPLNELDKYFSKTEAIEKLDKKIAKLREEKKEMEQKKKYFESTFHKYFEEMKTL